MSGSLKEFDKWNKEDVEGIVLYPYKSMYTNLHREGWRAALEWVHIKLTGDIMLSRRDRDRVDSIIKKELGE